MRKVDLIDKLNNAILEGNLVLVRQLAAECDSLDVLGRNGLSPLMYAAGLERDELCLELIQFGADVNFQGDSGTTALHMAVLESITEAILISGNVGAENTSTVYTLLKQGASPDIVDINGDTALDLAKSRDSTVLCNLLTNTST